MRSCLPRTLRIWACAVCLIASLGTPSVGTASGGSSLSSFGVGSEGELLVPAGPWRPCPGGGRACLLDGEPFGQIVGAAPPVSAGTWLVRSLVVHGATHGTTRIAALHPTGPGAYEVAGVSAALPIVPGPNRLQPGVLVAAGQRIALTDVRALAHALGEPRVMTALTPTGGVGALVTEGAGPERGQLPYALAVVSDRDGDGVADDEDFCHGPQTGAICPASVDLDVSWRPQSALTPGQRGWLDAAVTVRGPAPRAQEMGVLFDVAIRPADAGLALPGECAQVARDLVETTVRCRAAYVAGGARLPFSLQVTPTRPGGVIAATARLHTLHLRSAAAMVPLLTPPLPVSGRVRVRGLDAFRPRLRLLRPRSARAVRVDVHCPGGWKLTRCPVDVEVLDGDGRRLGRSAGLQVRSGGRRVVTIPLTSRARRALLRRGSLPVRIVATRSDVDGREVQEVLRTRLRAPERR